MSLRMAAATSSGGFIVYLGIVWAPGPLNTGGSDSVNHRNPRQ